MASFLSGAAGGRPLDGVRRRVLPVVARTPVYRLLLGGRVPGNLAVRALEPWPGDAARGAALVAGEYPFAGERISSKVPVWQPAGARPEWLIALHGFTWLADLRAAAGSPARETARELTRNWIAAHPAWHPLIWRADVAARRIAAWIAHFEDLVGSAGGDPLRPVLLDSLVRQWEHLRRVAAWEADGAQRIAALMGVVAGAVALGGRERRLAQALADLDRELQRQILPDGGHIARSPRWQLAVLRDLIDTRHALRAGQTMVPQSLQSAIDRMAPIVRFFRHGDGGLAQFNDTSEGDAAIIDIVLTRSEARGRAPVNAPHSGFQRLQAGKTLIVVDTGPPPSPGFDGSAHAGTLSLEMSFGRERLVVNCGAYDGPNADWRRVARTTAAHSTLVVADTNSSEILPDGSIGRRPQTLRCERAEDEGSQWVAATHDGYAPNFGLVHGRQLFLAADGEDLRGEDSLTGRAGDAFTIRFHLHPSVQVSLAQDGQAALLRLPSGAGWRLRAAGAELGLAESVYLGGGDMKKTQQLVLSGRVGAEGASVKWAIRREAKKPPED